MKVGFRLNSLGFGGVEVAVYDYALFNQDLLGNESVIFYREEESIYFIKEKFSKKFQIIPYKYKSDIDVNLNNIDVLYTLKSGERDEYIFDGVKNCVHAVFNISQPHGDRFASISRWLSKSDGIGLTPWVPHIINLPDIESDLREELCIPKDAHVFGRHGSFNEFNVPFVWKSIKESLEKRSNLYFVFLNTPRVLNHERIIYIDPIWDLEKKTEFINSCDAMLHARFRGETFGIACGEFSIKNRPVLTYGLSREKAHIDILGINGVIYNTERELTNLLINTTKDNKNWDSYSKEYSPIPVMNEFKKIFL